MTSYQNVSVLVDNGLKSLGVEARRLNSTYVTTCYRLASTFGKIYEIFPINGFHYTWCKNADDLVFDFPNAINYGAFTYKQEFVDALEKYLETSSDDTSESNFNDYYRLIERILKSINKENEPGDSCEYNFIRLPKYHPLRIQFDTFFSRTNLTINKFIKRSGLQSDTNLLAGLKSKHEIWIKGSYIAVNTEEFPVTDSSIFYPNIIG